MKKIIIAICLYVALPFPAAGEELKFVTQDFPPFTYKNEETVSGPATEIIRLICSEMRIKCSFELLPWRRAQYEVRTGQADGMFLVGKNIERSEWLSFSPPLLKTQYGFFVRKDNPLKYQNPEDIAENIVGVFSPSNTANSLEKLREQMIETNLQPIIIQKVHDDILAFRMLDRGDRNIDLVYSNRNVGFAIIHQENLKNILYAGTHKELLYYIGFSKKYADMQLVEKFNDTLNLLYKMRAIQEILTNHHIKAADLK